jgi:5-amino-6-(5-phosphoribosylamino)uracil reductase
VLLSAAMSADGYLDDATDRRLILSDQADLDAVDAIRAECDAILIGAQTVRSDDPALLVRSAQRREQRVRRGLPPSPLRVTLTASGELDPGARLFRPGGGRPLVYAPAGVVQRVQARLGEAAEVVGAEVVASGTISLPLLLADLTGRRVRTLLVEGGASILGQFLAEGLADEFRLAIAPVFVADPAAPRLLAGAPVPPPMQLTGVAMVGSMAVLSYRPARRS